MRLHYAYIAGFFDGDGCISCSLVDQQRQIHRKATLAIHVGFFNQNLDVLTNIMETIECGEILACVGNRHAKRGVTGAYRLEIPNKQIARVLTRLLPYLQVKREQARVMLMLLQTRMPRGNKPMPLELLQQRQALVQKLQQLNHADSQAYRTKWVNSVELSRSCHIVARYAETIPSQARAAFDSLEGVETSSVSANNNRSHEDPPRKGKYSPPSTVM